MKILYPLTLLLIITFLSTSCNKQSDDKRWYKGNLHTHSYWSDGDEFPEMIMDWYKSNDYQFVTLSDHNILAEGEKWKKIPNSILLKKGFEQYLQKYGQEWVVHKEDSSGISVKLKTLKEYQPLFEEPGKFLILQGEEVTTGFDEKPIHINATNIQEVIMPLGGTSVVEVMQNNIDAILEQRQRLGVPILPHINHPNFFYGISAEDLIGLRGEQFFEVYNGHPLVNNFGDSLHLSTEEMWDVINMAYIKNKQPLMYGIATDDSHNYHSFGEGYSNTGRGWVMVLAETLSPGALIGAMELGQFYASTGVTLKTASYRDGNIAIEVEPESGVNYEIQFIGATKEEEKPRLLKQTEGHMGQFTLTDGHLFVRAKIISSKVKENPFQAGEFEVAWTQPVTPSTNQP